MKRSKFSEEQVAYALRQAAILDGEIVCCGPDGRPRFYDLMFGRGRPLFYAFDLLWLDGVDLRRQPLVARKRRLRLLLGRQRTGVVRYVDAVAVDGCALFAEVCRRDLEGIVAKWAAAPYGLFDGRSSWVKIKNREYPQARDRARTLRAIGIRRHNRGRPSQRPAPPMRCR